MENIHISRIHSVVYIESVSSGEKRVVYGNSLKYNELIFKISGDCVTSFNGKKLHSTANTVRLLPKTDNPEYYVDTNEPGACIDVFFDTLEELPKGAYTIDTTKNMKLYDLFYKLYRIWTRKQHGYYNKCLSLLYEIFGEIEMIKYVSSEKVKCLEKGIDYLNKYATSQDIDYSRPAELCGICPTYFRRAFKENFGISPSQYVRKIRIDYAKELLVIKRYSISEIANMCGYGDVFQFSKQFKKLAGVSPKNFNIIDKNCST